MLDYFFSLDVILAGEADHLHKGMHYLIAVHYLRDAIAEENNA